MLQNVSRLTLSSAPFFKLLGCVKLWPRKRKHLYSIFIHCHRQHMTHWSGVFVIMASSLQKTFRLANSFSRGIRGWRGWGSPSCRSPWMIDQARPGFGALNKQQADVIPNLGVNKSLLFFASLSQSLWWSYSISKSQVVHVCWKNLQGRSRAMVDRWMHGRVDGRE